MFFNTWRCSFVFHFFSRFQRKYWWKLRFWRINESYFYFMEKKSQLDSSVFRFFLQIVKYHKFWDGGGWAYLPHPPQVNSSQKKKEKRKKIPSGVIKDFFPLSSEKNLKEAGHKLCLINWMDHRIQYRNWKIKLNFFKIFFINPRNSVMLHFIIRPVNNKKK